MNDVIIIGMGIGGMTAGIYLKRAGKNVLILEKKMPGGALNNISVLNNYPGYKSINGTDLALNLLDQVNSLEIPYKMEEVLSIKKDDNTFVVETNKSKYDTKKVIIATGRAPKYLGLDNEKDYLGKGISTCATCDGALYKGEDIAVVGSMDSALSESLYLSNIVNKLYLINKASFQDSPLYQEVLKKENIEVIENTSVDKINEVDKKIESISLSNGRSINIKAIFMYAGFRPDTDIFKNLKILNDNNEIVTNEVFETKIDGLYAIGDCIQKKLYQLVTAASDGAIAATDIIKKL